MKIFKSMILWVVRSQQTVRGVSWPKSLRIKRIDAMCHRAARIFKSPTHNHGNIPLITPVSLTDCLHLLQVCSTFNIQPSKCRSVFSNMQVCFQTCVFIFKYYLRVFKYFSQLRAPSCWLAGDVYQQEANGWTHFLIILRPRISAIHQQINWPNFPPQLTLHTAHRRT